MSGVSNGQIANAQTFNDAFMTRTGDTDTTGSLTIGKNLKRSVEKMITAHSGGGQANAYQLSKDLSFVEFVAADDDSIKLPPAAVGASFTVFHMGDDNILKVFPYAAEHFDALPINDPIDMMLGDVFEFSCRVANFWNVRRIYAVQPVVAGGTGAITKAAAFDNLAPTTAIGDLIVRGASSNIRVPQGAADTVAFVNPAVPTRFTYRKPIQSAIGLEWYEEDSPALQAFFAHREFRMFGVSFDQNMFAMLKIPRDFLPTTQLFLRIDAFSGASGSMLMRCQTKVLRPGTTTKTGAFVTYTSTNAPVALSGATDQIPQPLLIDLCALGGSGIQAGDELLIRLYRDNTDSSPDDVGVNLKSSEVTFT